MYSEREAAIVRYSQEVTHEPPRVSDATFAELQRHFDRRQIVQIAMLAGLSAMVNRIHATFLTDPDEMFLEQLEGVACPIPIPAVPDSAISGARA